MAPAARNVVMVCVAARCALFADAGAAVARAQPADNVRAAERGPEGVARVLLTPEAGIVSLDLTNGLRVNIRPMPGCGRVQVAATVLAGLPVEDAATRGFSEAACVAWHRVEGVPEVSLTRTPTPEGLAISAAAPAGRAGAAVRQVAVMLARPEIDAARLAAWKGQMRVGLARRAGSARSLAYDAVMETLLPADHEGRGIRTPEQAEAIAPGPLAEWLRATLRTSPIEVAIVGDVALDEAVALAATELAGGGAGADGGRPALEARERPGPGAQRGVRDLRDAVRVEVPPRLRRTRVTPSDEPTPPRALVALAAYGPDLADLAEVRVLNVAADCLEREALTAVQEAGFPTATVQCEVSPARWYRGTGLLLLSASVAAADARDHEDDVLAALRAALERCARTGPDADTLREVVERRSGDALRRLAEPEYWAAVLSFAECHALPLADLARVVEVLQALTPAHVARAAARAAAARPLIQVIVAPEPARAQP